jgi:hypothetical protein
MTTPAHTLPPQRKILIEIFDWEQFDHPHLSPDLAPSDFHVFLHLNIFVGGRQFDDDGVKEAVNTRFAS